MARRKRPAAIDKAKQLRSSAKTGRSWALTSVWTPTWDSMGASISPWPGAGGWLFAAALLAAVMLAYQPAWQGVFIWDDDLHLLNNPVLQPNGWLHTWVPGSYVNYWPITFEAYRLQYAVWRLNPIGFHVVNIVLHALSALFCGESSCICRRPAPCSRRPFSRLHPVNVESVAWITQLKNILSLLLTLVSMLFYLKHERYGGRWRYAASLGVFCLATLSKGMTLTLPVVLLACAWWQRGRIARRDVLRAAPFLLVGLLMAGMEIYLQHVSAAGAGVIVRCDDFFSRAAVAGCAVWFYVGKLIWPVHLLFVYPRWNINEYDWLSYLPGVLLAVILAAAWQRRKTWGRPLLMLTVCYVVLLMPALGFANIYFMRYSLVADHWQYAAMIVPCTFFAGATATLAGLGRWGRPAGCLICLGLSAVLAFLTFRQSQIYANLETLYTATIAGNPDCWLAHGNLGEYLASQGKPYSAIAEYRKALKINPDCLESRNNLGYALAGLGRFNEAVAEYRKAIKIKPDCTTAYRNLADALAKLGWPDDSIAAYREALKAVPDNMEIHNNLAGFLLEHGRIDEAIGEFQAELKIAPNFLPGRNNLGNALLSRGKTDQAIAEFRRTLEIAPNFAPACFNLGNILAGINPGGLTAGRERFDEAIDCLQKAVKLNPDMAAARQCLERAIQKRADFLKSLSESASVSANSPTTLPG